MLLSTVSLALVLAAHVANAAIPGCPAFGTVAPSVNGTNNYVIDKFQDLLYFTYAIEKCTATGLVSTNAWYKYSCSNIGNTWKVTKKSYSDADCTTVTDESVTTWTEGQSKAGYQGYFVCDGENTYVKVEVSAIPNCPSTQTVYAGLGGCAFNSVPIKFYCDNDKALVELYLNNSPFQSRRLLSGLESSSTELESSTEMETSTETPETTSTTTLTTTTKGTTAAPLLCNAGLYCDAWKFQGSCQNVLNFTSPLDGSVTRVYGKLDECVAKIVETTVVDNGNGGGKSGAASLFVITNLVAAVVVALFSMF